jgi:hypothetical protein
MNIMQRTAQKNFVFFFTLFAIGILLTTSAVLGPVGFAHALTIGTPVVDGDNGEWDPDTSGPDFFAEMHIQGNPSKPHVANAYVQYDPSTHILYVMVLHRPNPEGYVIEDTPVGNAWAYVDGDRSTKVYNDKNIVTLPQTGDPNFAWVEDSGGLAIGYEAAFMITSGSHEIVIHVEVSLIELGTGATEGFGHDQPETYIVIPPDLVIPEVPLGTIAAVAAPSLAALVVYKKKTK